MRILLSNYLETTAAGGINTTVSRVSKSLAERGHTVRVFQANPAGKTRHESLDGFEIHRTGDQRHNRLYGFDPGLRAPIESYVRDTNPQLIHVHGYHTLFSPEVIFMVKRIAPSVPVVFSPHLGPTSHNTWAGAYAWNAYAGLISRWLRKSVDRIVADSSYERAIITESLGFPKERVTVIGLGVERIEQTPKGPREGTPRLLYAGYLNKYKGVDYVIKTLHSLKTRLRMDARLTIIGEGDYEDELRRLVARLGLEGSVKWRDFVPYGELLDAMRQADIFLQLSRCEAFGVVVAEALASGTPAIVARTTALAEFASEPGCFVVDWPPDPDIVAELVARLWSDSPQVGPFTERIRTWDSVALEYEKLYRAFTMRGSGGEP